MLIYFTEMKVNYSNGIFEERDEAMVVVILSIDLNGVMLMMMMMILLHRMDC